ncbi:hypothetical protein [Candidatus Nitrosotenuis cloacae]|uniref:hypothetical protein n=1 Tax=Candidatus Nitrosotenuis cloacae TaxID=1603555 RepID=UPI002282E7E9|nr:hypothetical protein [Candidatus Nitrosotenuis cloacae]
MKISVQNTGDDKINILSGGLNDSLHVNSIETIHNKTKYEMPAVAANTVELEYFNKSKVRPKTQLVQAVVKTLNKTEIHNKERLSKIKKQYQDLFLQNTDSIIDFYFQHPQAINLDKNERKIIHEIQYDANATILSDHESNRNQNEDDFEAEILETRDKYKDITVSPTIDIGVQEEHLAGKKIDKILDNDFSRFNVIFRSVPDNHPNWIDLSQKIAGRNIWVNVVGVTQRWYNPKLRISQMSRVFLYGVHSASQGYPWRGTANTPAYILNEKTLCYDFDRNMSYEKSRAESNNIQQQVLFNSIPYIKKKLFYKTFVPSKFGLNHSFNSIT